MIFEGLFPRRLRVISLLCVALLSVVPTLHAQDVVGDVYASDASVHGSIMMAGGGTRVLSGSTVSAGLTAATVKLARGGSVRVCPGTNVALSSSQSGRALGMGFNSGAVELQYELAASADTLQTSDFRLLLAGPGSFHLAISADQLGNTCVKPLAQNTSSVIVQELFGDGSYQVKADESVVFRKGKVANLSRDVPPDCGCPALPEVKRADSEDSPPRRGGAEKAQNQKADAVPASAPNPTTAEMVAKPAGSTPVEVESPFVYHADPAVPDPPVIANVRLSERGRALVFQPVVLPPARTKVSAPNREPAKPQMQKGFFARVRSFFGGIFK